jgi:hypothetical protein
MAEEAAAPAAPADAAPAKADAPPAPAQSEEDKKKAEEVGLSVCLSVCLTGLDWFWAVRGVLDWIGMGDGGFGSWGEGV